MDTAPELAERILIVDDDESLQRAITRVLTISGYRCLTAADGASALETAERERPDLIVLDLNLPRVNGIGVVTRLREHPDLADLPVVMLSAEDAVDQKVEALAAGVDTYLTKPMDLRELVAHVKAILRLKRRVGDPAASGRAPPSAAVASPKPPAPVVDGAPPGDGQPDASAPPAPRAEPPAPRGEPPTEPVRRAAIPEDAAPQGPTPTPTEPLRRAVVLAPASDPRADTEPGGVPPTSPSIRVPVAVAGLLPPAPAAPASPAAPLAAAAVPAPAPAPAPNPVPQGASGAERPPCVLIIDDDKSMVELLAAPLEARGMKAVAEGSVAEAVRRVEKERFDAILLDLDLADRSGVEVVREIRRRRDAETVPILALSAAEHPEVVELAFEAGANDFVEKPFQPQLLVVKVEMMLRRLRALRFFQQASEGPARGPEGTLLVASALELGRFKLLQPIDAGTSGTVYRAEDPSGAPVAVKVLAVRGRVGPESVAHFQREAAALAALRHENIVRVIEAGQVLGYYFLAMEWVEGRSLRTRIEQEGPLPPADLRRMGLDVGRALACAAGRGIVHRDVKPANILIRAQTGEALLGDFGVALALREKPGERGDRKPARVGTPLYMSPEAVRGERLDLRSDLYSLGATLYHAAAGHPPFPGPYVEAVYAAQLSAPPPPLDKRRDLDPALKAALFRLLDKDPARRFQHPAEWVAALERVPDGAGSPAAPASAPSAPS